MQGRDADRALAEAWGDYLDRHRDEIAENFERAAELIRAGDTHGLAEHVGRNRRARAEAAASDSHAATAPRFVVFEETGEEREVKTWCLRCQADSDFTILSPSGKAHYSSETGEDTRCGINATGDDWWHRL